MRIHPVDHVKRLSARANSAPGRLLPPRSTLSTCLLLVLSPSLALADDWINPGTGDWFLDSNWADGTVPTAVDNCVIDNGGTAQVQSIGAECQAGLIGSIGNGSIVFGNAGSLASTSVTIGVAVGAVGSVQMIGPDTRWTVGDLWFGFAGEGRLNMAQGAVLDSVNSTLGSEVGGQGHAIVSGHDSVWRNQQLMLGYGGSASLSIDNGGVVDGGNVWMGLDSSGSGSLDVTNSGSRFTANQLIVGQSGDGRMSVTDGAKVSSTTGDVFGKTASVNIIGPGSTWENMEDLRIGASGTASLFIGSGGSVTNNGAAIAIAPGSRGMVEVNGAGSTWINLGTLYLGSSGGNGSVIINRGGFVGSAVGEIAAGELSNGEVLVDGAGSRWVNSGDLAIGLRGKGTLTLNRGGAVSAHNVGVASIAGSDGTLIVDGVDSLLTSDTMVNVGNVNSTTGVVAIRNGGKISSIGASLSASNADVLIDGSGSSWTNELGLSLFSHGVVSFIVRNGGSIISNGAGVGANSGSTALIVVDGKGSSWISSGEFGIAGSGVSEVIVRNGGEVRSTVGNVGSTIGGVGRMTVSGIGSRWDSTLLLGIGLAGVGSLSVTDGGKVTSDRAVLGSRFGGSGEVIISGIESSWDTINDVVVSAGSITISNRGKLSVGGSFRQLLFSGGQDRPSNLIVGDGGAPGTIDVGVIKNSLGDGSVIFNHNSGNYVFTSNGSISGAAPIIGGTTAVSHIGLGVTGLLASNSYTGPTSINAGTLRVNGSIISHTTANNGGTLGGSGTVAAVDVEDGGTISPGSPVGTLTTAALTLAGASRLNFELGAPDAAGDMLVVNGDLVLDGVLNAQALSGFSAGTYRLITFAGALTDNTLDINQLPTGFQGYIDTATSGQVNLIVTSGRPVANSPPSGTVTITGAVREGSTLGVVNTLADTDGLGAFSYQWFLSDVPIADATSASLILDDLAVGKMVRVAVSYTDGQGFAEQVSSAAVGPVTPAGTDLPFQKRLFFVNPADNANQQTFIRLVNPNDADVAVQIQGFDDNGMPAPGGEVVLMLSAQQSLQLNAADLELGNAGKGMDGALGNGIGKWQLKVNSSAPIEAMSLIRTPDGFLTSVTETVPTEAAGVHVLYFANPGSNPNQQSFIRVVNRSGASGAVNVSAVDDAGIPAPGGDIRFTLAANAALNFNAEDYTNGNPAKGLQGAFGSGTGKWQLTVSSALNLEVMSLIRTPDGFLTDLSNIAPRAASGDDSNRLLLSVVSGSNTDQQGLIRLVNRGGLAENVTLSAIDDAGIRAPTSAVVAVAPFAAVQLLASEMEQGNPAKGLSGAFGAGQGRWQIDAAPQARVEAQSLLRVPGGFLTNLSASAPRESQFEARLWIFNPGSNDQQRSILRLINRSDSPGVAMIEAIDDLGQPSPGGSVSLDIAPRSAVELSALELEDGNTAKGLIGALGDGEGKWRLRISADVAIEVQGLLETPTGFLTDLSSTVQ